MKELNKQITSDRFIGCDSDYQDADIVLFGAGFDGTTSYRPGARFGGKVIRAESYGLESYSPYLNKELTDIKVFDSGELELPFGNTEKTLLTIYKAQKQILNDNKIPVMLGGEHLVTLPAIEACSQKYPDLRLIHFDAHTDLRDEYLGEKLSHACVMRRCWEVLGDNRIYSFGVRSGTREEFEWGEKHIHLSKEYAMPTISSFLPNFTEGFDVVNSLGDNPVYLTIDIDVLDPSEFPATGTPEAGGVRFLELIQMIRYVCGANIVGADLVEYSHPYDTSGVCAATAGKVLRELLLSI
ncbi:MAG: agmatinase [Oscillospiraceae bacterium]|nr:agmatinase [Oscillospiraceae bacterium]